MQRRVLRMIRSVRFGSRRRLVGLAFVASVLVLLVSSAAAASGGRAPALAKSTTVGAPVTVTVTISGAAGWVESTPPGISCGSTCSAQFPDGTLVVLVETPVNTATVGSAWGSWSAAPPYYCVPSTIHDAKGKTCAIILDASVGTSVSAQATFLPLVPRPGCTAPHVEGRTLAKAKAILKQRHCGVGNVKYAFSLKINKGRVISQNPKAHWALMDGAVDLVVGTRRR